MASFQETRFAEQLARYRDGRIEYENGDISGITINGRFIPVEDIPTVAVSGGWGVQPLAAHTVQPVIDEQGIINQRQAQSASSRTIAEQKQLRQQVGQDITQYEAQLAGAKGAVTTGTTARGETVTTRAAPGSFGTQGRATPTLSDLRAQQQREAVAYSMAPYQEAALKRDIARTEAQVRTTGQTPDTEGITYQQRLKRGLVSPEEKIQRQADRMAQQASEREMRAVAKKQGYKDLLVMPGETGVSYKFKAPSVIERYDQLKQEYGRQLLTPPVQFKTETSNVLIAYERPKGLAGIFDKLSRAEYTASYRMDNKVLGKLSLVGIAGASAIATFGSIIYGTVFHPIKSITGTASFIKGIVLNPREKQAEFGAAFEASPAVVTGEIIGTVAASKAIGYGIGKVSKSPRVRTVLSAGTELPGIKQIKLGIKRAVTPRVIGEQVTGVRGTTITKATGEGITQTIQEESLTITEATGEGITQTIQEESLTITKVGSPLQELIGRTKKITTRGQAQTDITLPSAGKGTATTQLQAVTMTGEGKVLAKDVGVMKGIIEDIPSTENTHLRQIGETVRYQEGKPLTAQLSATETILKPGKNILDTISVSKTSTTKRGLPSLMGAGGELPTILTESTKSSRSVRKTFLQFNLNEAQLSYYVGGSLTKELKIEALQDIPEIRKQAIKNVLSQPTGKDLIIEPIKELRPTRRLRTRKIIDSYTGQATETVQEVKGSTQQVYGFDTLAQMKGINLELAQEYAGASIKTPSIMPTLSLRTIPMLSIRNQPKQSLSSKPILQTVIRPAIKSLSINKLSSATIQSPALKTQTLTRQQSLTRQAQVSMQATGLEQISISGLSYGSADFSVPILGITPPIFKTSIPGGGSGGLGLRLPKREGQPKRRTPSGFAAFFGIKGSINPTLEKSGLSIRPLAQPRRRRKR